jgi:hypothetical protein
MSLARRLAAIYAIFAISVFVFPGGLVSWLDDRNASGWLDAPLAAARAVDTVSAAVGVKGVGERLHQRFRGWVGDEG